MHHVLTQYTRKEGLQRYKGRRKKSVEAELKQIHDKLTFAPTKKSALTQQQHADALQALIFLKEKWFGKLKGCICADGRKQQKKSKK